MTADPQKPSPAAPDAPPQPGKPSNAILLWAGLAFALLIAAWAAFFLIASKSRIEHVPLEHRKPAAQTSPAARP